MYKRNPPGQPTAGGINRRHDAFPLHFKDSKNGKAIIHGDRFFLPGNGHPSPQISERGRPQLHALRGPIGRRLLQPLRPGAKNIPPARLYRGELKKNLPPIGWRYTPYEGGGRHLLPSLAYEQNSEG